MCVCVWKILSLLNSANILLLVLPFSPMLPSSPLMPHHHPYCCCMSTLATEHMMRTYVYVCHHDDGSAQINTHIHTSLPIVDLNCNCYFLLMHMHTRACALYRQACLIQHFSFFLLLKKKKSLSFASNEKLLKKCH